MSAKRLLLVTDEMEVGGSQRQISHLLAGLDRSRWQPELVYFRSHSFLVDALRQAGVVVHHLPKRGRIDPGFALEYARLLRRGRYDVVHAFSLTAELWTALACLVIPSAPPLVSSVRGLYLDKSARFWRMKRFVALRSHAMIANARACADVAAARTRIASTSIDVVPNGVSPPSCLSASARTSLRERIGCPPDRVLALFVGRLVNDKNLPCLVRALARLPQGQRPWLAVAGDGPLRAPLLAQIAQAGVQGDIALLGERDDATTLMQAADLLVLPSVQEGMSNAVLEAMAAGCPVIASAVGGNRELVIDGVSGLLFPSDDDAALADCLQRLARDGGLRASLAENALRRVHTEHSVDGMVQSTTAVYDRCARQQRRPHAPVNAPHRRDSPAAGSGR